MKTISPDLLIKVVTAIIALSSLIYVWLKDLGLKRKNYADSIRNSAGEIIAKLDRRKSIMLSFYEEIQPLITDADILLVESNDVTKTRDKFWRDIVVVSNQIRSRILDEQIEIAYISLIGYEPTIMERYQSAIGLLTNIDEEIKKDALIKTQGIIKSQEFEIVDSATLGNLLRREMFDQCEYYTKQIGSTVLQISNHLGKLIRKNDSQIYHKK